MESCYRALKVEAEAREGSFNSEAFANLNIALRLCGQRERAIRETWEQIGVLHASASGEPYRVPRVELPPLAAALDSAGGEGSAAAGLTVVCVKWGTKYGPEYVNRLRLGVERALGGAVRRFVCFTEDGEGLRPDVEVLPLQEREGWQGWWFKASIFSAQAGLRGLVLYIDLDTVIVGSLRPLLSYRGGFATLNAADFSAEEGVDDGFNSSLILWEAGGEGVGRQLCALHDSLSDAVFRCLMRWDHWLEMVVPTAHTLQQLFPGLFVDYRKHCSAKGPPQGAALVCFPRNPKPHQLQDPWISHHWSD